MTKTKRQLRAEAVERLKRLQDRSPIFDSDIGSAIADGGLLSDVIDLLTDDDSIIQEVESTIELLSDGADSREKLEYDVKEICWGKNDNRHFAQKRYLSSYGVEVDEGNVMANHEGHVLMTVIMHLLDRQDAITEEKTRYKLVTASAEEIAAWRSKAEKLKEQFYELTAERDMYREKLSRALDHAHEIERLMP